VMLTHVARWDTPSFSIIIRAIVSSKPGLKSLVVKCVILGARALEKLNYSSIKDRAW
jgi:hypothetical protein